MHGVLSLVTGHQFVGQIADHFIDVHVDAGVAAALAHIERKLLFKSSGDHFVASLFNGYCNFRLQSSDFGVGQGAGLLDFAKRDVHVRVGNHGKARCARNLEHASCLNAVVTVIGDGHFTEAIAFNTGVGHFEFSEGSVFEVESIINDSKILND